MSGEHDQEKKDRLCLAAKAGLVTEWRFSIFQKFINEYKSESSSDIDDLVIIAETGQCVTNSATG